MANWPEPTNFFDDSRRRRRWRRRVDNATQRLNEGLERLEMDGSLDDDQSHHDEPWWLQRPPVVIQTW